MNSRLGVPPAAVVPVRDSNGCIVTWAVNTVVLDPVALGLTAVQDKDSLVVKLVDDEGCVQAVAVKSVPAPAP